MKLILFEGDVKLYACDRCGDVKAALPGRNIPRGWLRLREDTEQQHCGDCQLETAAETGWIYQRMES